MSGEWIAKLVRAATWFLLAILLAATVLWQVHLVGFLDFDGELLSTDAESLYGLRCARDGGSPYHDFSHAPYAVTLYGPLFYVVPGTIARVLHASWIGTIVCGRLYTYLSWLGVAVVIYALGRRIGCQGPAAVAGVLLWLSGTLASGWAVAYRPDATAILLALGALWVYQRGESARAVALTVALLVAAFLHKQTAAVSVLLAIAITEIERRRFGRAVAVVGGWTICTIIAVAVTQWLSRGAFVKNAFEAVAVWAGSGQVWGFLREAMIRGMVVFAGAAMSYVLFRHEERLALLRRSFIVSVMLTLVTSAKAGAQLNYYLEPFALACVLAAGLLRDEAPPVTGRLAGPLRIGWLGLAIMACAANLSWTGARFPAWCHDMLDHGAIRAQQARNWERLAGCLGELNERVLVEDLYLAVRQCPTPCVVHPRHLEALRGAGLFDDSDLVRRIADGRFDAIIASFPLEQKAPTRQFPARWLDAANRRYVLEQRCEGDGPGDAFYVYRATHGADPRSPTN
ncbi:MAG: hypothetical protein ABSA12_07720 [Verrucomicrobiia bacterium]